MLQKRMIFWGSVFIIPMKFLLDFLMGIEYTVTISTGKEVNMADIKRGRPKLASNVKKSASLKILLNESEQAILKECAEHYGISKAGVLMMGLNLVYSDVKKEKGNGEF